MRSRIATAVFTMLAAACGKDTSYDPTDAAVADCPDCPRCGEVALGESEISQEHRIDLVFEAVIALDRSTAFAETDLRQSLVRLGDEFGVEVSDSTPLADMVAAVTGAVQIDFTANLEEEISVASSAARCFADDEAAQHAVRSCEVAAGCDVVDVELSDTTFRCDGTCVGACVGELTGTCTRQVRGTCSGTCAGTCALDAPGPCVGTCVGTCDGTCDGSLSTSMCVGHCAGNCTGACETPFGADCAGTCGGLCTVEASGECGGVADGACLGSCVGDCEGLATAPPDVESACDAAVVCQDRSALLGVAQPRCRGASLEIRYDFNAALDDEAKAAFFSEMAAFEHEMETISRIGALAEFVQSGAAEGGAIGAISAGVEEVVSADLSSYTIIECLVPCVLPAFEAVVEMNADTGTAAQGIGEAAVEMLSIIGGE